ncbi:hypothetical protein JTE90_004179 [Oedothorax gibbosus]|uniref:Uncharacterized protein n=1 Tax=Oedothorax gibbosus TaxID=931172 RepID=A0AAV6TVQ2_9ARAC|nr:hypothetical protein JTE90_004179 [Oedothorax gibbosus]
MQHSNGKKHQSAAKSIKGQSKLFCSKNSASTTVSANDNVLALELSNNHLVAKAEAIWAMKVAASNYSFASCKDIVPIFQAMFEGHSVAKQMQLSEKKVTYVLSHGLGPYFQDEIISELKKSSNWFTLGFDETTTYQIKKQLDLYVRFWSDKFDKVLNAYIHSVFLGHADSEKVSTSIIDTLNDNKLPLNSLLMLSMDGPNVNL